MAYQMGMLTSFLPAFLLSGFVFAIENMPVVIQVVSYVFPSRYFVTILKGIFLKGVGLDVLWMEVMLLVVYALAAVPRRNQEAEAEDRVNAMWRRIREILRKEFRQMLREPRMRAHAVRAAADPVAHLRLRRQPGRREQPHRLDGQDRTPAEPASCGRVSKARATSG